MILEDGYSIERLDQYNWTLNKNVTRTATRKSKNHEAGDSYVTTELIGYYPSLALAYARYCDLTYRSAE